MSGEAGVDNISGEMLKAAKWDNIQEVAAHVWKCKKQYQ